MNQILTQECINQLEYLNDKFGETGTTNQLLSKLKRSIEQKPSPEPDKDTLSINVRIDMSDLQNLFITAFEGGINYWAIVLDQKIDLSHCDGESSSEKWFDAIWNKQMEMPINDAEDEAVELGVLTKEKMKSGLKMMAETYPEHYNDFITEQYDVYTADIWLQLSVLGEIIYG